MGNSQFNFSMPPENGYVPVRKAARPAHRKSRPSLAAVAVASMLGGALATTGVMFALVPAITGNSFVTLFGTVPVAEAAQSSSQQANMPASGEAKTVPAVMTQSQKAEAKQTEQAIAVKSPYPVHRKAAAQGVEASARAEEAPESEQPVETPAEPDGRVWVAGYTEKVVHPAVYEEIPDYESYICTDCGYESLDQSDIIEHIEEHESAAYLTVENDCPRVELEKEWTEEIYHEGQWE